RPACVLFDCFSRHSSLPSFPTRRSSDLTLSGHHRRPHHFGRSNNLGHWKLKHPHPVRITSAFCDGRTETAAFVSESGTSPTPKRSARHPAELHSLAQSRCRPLTSQKTLN